MDIRTLIAQPLARMREAIGITVTWKGQIIHGTETIPDAPTAASLAEGLGINADNPDIRIWRLTPTDFANGVYPPEMDTLVKHEAGMDVAYIIAKRAVPSFDGVDLAVVVVVSRAAPGASATDAAPTEAGAGQRKRYTPPVTTLPPSK